MAPERDGPRPPEEQRAEGNQRQAGSSPSDIFMGGVTKSELHVRKITPVTLRRMKVRPLQESLWRNH